MDSTKRRKTSSRKEIVEKCRPAQTRIKHNNDHARIMHKIQYLVVPLVNILIYILFCDKKIS